MTDVNPNEFIVVRHPDTEHEAEVTRAAYDEVWKGKGWTVVDPGASRQELSKLTRPKLEELAADRGVDVSGARTKGDIIGLLAGDTGEESS